MEDSTVIDNLEVGRLRGGKEAREAARAAKSGRGRGRGSGRIGRRGGEVIGSK